MPFSKYLFTNLWSQPDNSRNEFSPSPLSKRLEKFSKVEALQAVGGLFTQPKFHANTLRLEHLIHLIMIYCTGREKVTHKNVKDWLEFLETSSQCCSQEDPIEDVFVSNLESYHGNLMVFEGIWTHNNYFLQAVINALYQCAKDQIREAQNTLNQVFSLLRLGDEIAKRTKLHRNIADLKSSPNTTDFSWAPKKFKEWGNYLIFSLEDLNNLQIPLIHLLPFFISEEKINKLKDEEVANSSLLSHPLVKIADDTFIISLLPALGVAARRFALNTAIRSGFINSFQKHIDQYHFQIFLEISLLLSLKPVDLDFITQEPYEFIASFDEGSYIHVILEPVDLTKEEASIMNSNLPFSTPVSDRIIEISKILSKQPNFRKGITIILHGGIGSGLYASFNADLYDKKWHIIPLTSGDLELLAYDSDFSLLRLYRLLERQRDPKNPLMPTEPLNLYGFFKEKNFDLYFDEAPSGMLVLFSPCEDQGLFRVTTRKLLDKHLLRDPSSPQWILVQRKNLSPYFSDMKEGKFYVSLSDISQQRLRGCYENNEYKWWVEINNAFQEFQPSSRMPLSYLLFETFEFWIERIAQITKNEFHLPKWIFFNIIYSDIEKEEDIILKQKSSQQLNIELSKNFFKKYQQAENEGERLLVTTLIKGMLILSNSKINEDLITNLVDLIIPKGHARHIHMFQPQSLSDFVFDNAPLEKPRLCIPEIASLIDNGFAFNLGVPNISEGQPDDKIVLKLLGKGMDVLWEKIQKRLNELDRKSVIIKALTNHDTILKERNHWERTASSLQACHVSEKDEVIDVSANQEALRATSAVCSRVIVEMAICESPTINGRICGYDDLDFLLTYIAKFIDLSAHYSEIKSGILGTNLFVLPSGKIDFKTDFLDNVKTPYMQQLYRGNFNSHVEKYPSWYIDKNIENEKRKAQLTREEHVDFFKAMEIEYSVSLETLGKLAGLLSERVIKQKKTILEISEKELLKICISLGMTEAQSYKTLKRLSLEPREKWKEPPSGHKEGDILPWRNQRKYSLISRPFIRIDDNPPTYLISIPGFEQSLKYLCQAVTATLATDLFYSDEMKKWIGSRIDELGLAFNSEVSGRLKELGFHTQVEVSMTDLGGRKENGDIDVLAWKKEMNTVYLVECKRLMTSKNTEEIVRRLTEYAPNKNPKGKRTPTQKHLDRIDAIKNNLDKIAQTTGIPKNKIQIKSCLVTSGVTPIPFQKTIKDCFDFILDFHSLEKLK